MAAPQGMTLLAVSVYSFALFKPSLLVGVKSSVLTSAALEVHVRALMECFMIETKPYRNRRSQR